MKLYIKNKDMTLEAEEGQLLLSVLRDHGMGVDAPCGGGGKCRTQWCKDNLAGALYLPWGSLDRRIGSAYAFYSWTFPSR